MRFQSYRTIEGKNCKRCCLERLNIQDTSFEFCLERFAFAFLNAYSFYKIFAELEYF